MTVSRFVVSVAKVMTGVGLAVAAYVFFEYYVAKHNWRYQTFRLVGEVVQINICPLASTKEICPEEVLCTPKGISLFGVHDREFFITRTKGPDFAVESPSKLVKEYFSESFREFEAYADINVLTINAPSGQNYDIDLTHSEHSHGPAQVYRASSIVAASDQGKKISSWLSQELGEEVHLFRQTDDIMMKFNRSNMAMCSICPEESVRHIQQKVGIFFF
ncbi:hypothetical protein Bpfe_023964 [Biomphalaria pfeifferi]|uniref:Molybdenum cofactor sulfurase middle domain-containing protein n=1 Tax=Biomphalaria pfeifferi TaxID=112525 RepID=A0AAD8B381_BIOPF|nr:hypothetical protein Bpfe_023964 [Biomphalaria pfeifferi]